ncbi:MAG: cyclic nucleotide-binding protein [Deltaproteobacteria bacterium]|nr:cyclic nucleotide-binding protein [Deltaproteobacteria bacterium]
MSRSRIAGLQRTPMFGAVSDQTLEFLLDRVDRREVKAGDYFFREGETGNSAYLLESGEASVLKDWCGQVHRLRGLSTGDCFGEVALLDLGKRSASIRADVDSDAIEIRAKDLHALVKRDPEQFALIYMNLGRELSRRLREADERLFRAHFEDHASLDGYAFEASKL